MYSNNSEYRSQSKRDYDSKLADDECKYRSLDNNIMYLKMYIEDRELKEFYESKITEHNNKVLSETPDSGFDLFVPDEFDVTFKSISFKINHKVKCSATYGKSASSYLLMPRSSMGAKTPLRLSNSIGLIDSGYRGDLIAIVDNLSISNYEVEKYQRLVQIVAPNLSPIYVILVDSENDLGITERGSGGLGSTGV